MAEETSRESKADKKSFWKRYDKLITVILALLFIYSVVFLSNKINFFLGNEMIVKLIPEQKSITIHYSEKSNADFEVSVINSAYCKVLCSYSFFDQRKNEIMDRGNFTIKQADKFKKSYAMESFRKGSGQDIYSFDVSCKSIPSILCPTNSHEIKRSSLVAVNYELTLSEKELKESLKPEIENFLEKLNSTNWILKAAEQRFNGLSRQISLNNLSDEKLSIENNFDLLRLSGENIISQWPSEDYYKTYELFNIEFIENLSSLNSRIIELENAMTNSLKAHNEITKNISEISAKLDYAQKLSNAASATTDTKFLFEELKRINEKFAIKNFSNYREFEDIYAISKDAEIIIENLSRFSFNLFNEINYFNYYENSLLCNLTECSYEYKQANDLLKDAENFNNSPAEFDNACASLDQLKNKFAEARKSNSFASNIDNGESEDYYNFIKASVNNSILMSINLDSSDERIRQSLHQNFPKNFTAVFETQKNDSIVSKILHSIYYSDRKKSEVFSKICSSFSNKSKISASLENDFENYSEIKSIETTLSSNPPICCVFGKCEKCCTDNSCSSNKDSYPVIFIHGHSFVKDNAPEYSLDSFNELQSKMQNDGFVNAGIISLYSKNDNVQNGVWGLSGKPVTVKASYYFDIYMQEGSYQLIPTKSENIDTYAIRIKEIIDVVKQRTGKDKVNIVAHSMGGLVARKYMQVFEGESVYKFIMIATPNYGVTGTAGILCGVIGENRECADMAKNSLFLNKLNNPLNIPNNARIYNIIGQGCLMSNNKNGDGVVVKDDALLDYASNMYINGTCARTAVFHTEILDIDRYPETYELVKLILKE